MTKKINHIKWILDEWRKHKLYICLLLVFTLLSASVAVIYPYLFRQLIDTIEQSLNSASPSMTPIYHIIWIMLIVGIVRLVASFYPSMRALMNMLFEYTLRSRYFQSILTKDYRFFLKFRTGDLVTRLTSDVQDFPKISWFLCSGIFRAFDAFIKVVFCLVAMFWLCWELTLIALIPIPLMVAVFFIVSERLYKSFKKNQEAVSEISNHLEMTFSGIKIIKNFVCEEKYKRFFNIALEKRYHTELRLVKIGTMMHLIYEYIDYLTMISIILFGGVMVVKGKISIGTFYAFYTYLGMLVYPILDLPQLFISGRQAFVCIDRLEEIKDFPTFNSPQIDSQDTAGKIKIDQIDSIKFDKVSFRYEDRKEKILDSVSFEVKKGEKILILGASGCGKSTILGLLIGQMPPAEGEILINGINIKEIDTFSLREHLGYVPQEPSLFTGTIQENIWFGGQEPEREQNTDTYHTIISAVQMKDEIDSFTDGDQTKIGQKGLTLSGGQKQRIAIARALYRQPQVLILDDITASLDAKKEELLWEHIAELFSDLTAFIVSHRLSSLRYADDIIFLENGKISAHGKHEDLLEKNNHYKDFIKHHYK